MEVKKIEKKNELASCKAELQKAILEERYEDAAVLRDKINKIELEENG
jgi:protein-arginine kinase activator protein McsA